MNQTSAKQMAVEIRTAEMLDVPELCKHGVKHLHILTGEANEKAQALYRSCGYKKTSEILLDKNLC